MLNIEYALQSYGMEFKNIIYRRRHVDKIIDTIIVAPEKNILPKFLNRIVYRLPKSAIDHSLVEEMEKSGLVGPLESNGSREILIPSTNE